MITPTVAPQHPTRPARGPDTDPRQTYDWSRIEPGVWQRWQDGSAAEIAAMPLPDARKRAERIRNAARYWARAHDLTLQVHRDDDGRTLDMRFDPKGDSQ